MHTYTKFKLWLSAPLRLAWALPGAIFLCATLSAEARAAGEPPSTFGDTIGSALLCIDQIDPYYYWSYMKQYFGPPYKQEGGAYWFKVKATLWGANITEVLVCTPAMSALIREMSAKALKLGIPLSVQLDLTYRCNGGACIATSTMTIMAR